MKKLISVIIALALFTCALPAFAEECADWYSSEDGKVKIELTADNGMRWQSFISGSVGIESQFSDSDGNYELVLNGYDGSESDAQVVLTLADEWGADAADMRALSMHVAASGDVSVVSARTADFSDLREFYNPEHYETMRITGAARLSDGRVCVRAGFGDPDTDAGKVAFYMEYVIWLESGCEVMMPADPFNPGEVEECADLVDWYSAASLTAGDEAAYEFFATFAMDEAGQLRSIVFRSNVI